MTSPDRASVVVRHATLADRDEWIRLRTALWPDGSDEHGADVDRYFAGDLPSLGTCLLAESRDTVVGLAEVSIRPFAEGCETRDVGYLEGWYVEPTWRGRGVGRALVEAAESWARERGCREFASDTAADDEASRRAHRACGFSEAGLVRCFVKVLEPLP